jgi:hypothetical protein
MLIFPHGHEIAQMAEFHSMPLSYQTDQKDMLDVSIVAILCWPTKKQAQMEGHMKAMVLNAVGRAFDFQGVDIAVPIGREVLVDVQASGAVLARPDEPGRLGVERDLVGRSE